jgi:hypothetical protein
MSALAPNEPVAEDTQKRAKRLMKALRQIEELKAHRAKGRTLERSQEQKIERESAMRQELAALGATSAAASDGTIAGSAEPSVSQHEAAEQGHLPKRRRTKPVPSAPAPAPSKLLPTPPPTAARVVEAELHRRETFREVRQAFAICCRGYRSTKGGILSCAHQRPHQPRISHRHIHTIAPECLSPHARSCFSKWHFALLRAATSTFASASSGSASLKRPSASKQPPDPLLPLPHASDVTSLQRCLSDALIDDGFAAKDARAPSSHMPSSCPPLHTKTSSHLS